MLTLVAVVSAASIDRLANSLDRLATMSRASIDRSLADAIRRGQAPELLDALKKAQG